MNMKVGVRWGEEQWSEQSQVSCQIRDTNIIWTHHSALPLCMGQTTLMNMVQNQYTLTPSKMHCETQFLNFVNSSNLVLVCTILRNKVCFILDHDSNRIILDNKTFYPVLFSITKLILFFKKPNIFIHKKYKIIMYIHSFLQHKWGQRMWMKGKEMRKERWKKKKKKKERELKCWMQHGHRCIEMWDAFPF